MSEESGGFAPLETGEEAADAAQSASGGTGPFDVLLETEPDLQPQQEAENLGVSPAAGHAYVGVRKVLHALTGVAGGSHGTPAIVNFGMAGFLSLSEMDAAPEFGGEGENQDVETEIEWEEDLG